MQTQLWTEPQIYPKSPDAKDAMQKTWRVWFRFFHAGKWRQVSRKGADISLNSITSKKERVVEAALLKKVLSERLVRGWNPITNTFPEKRPHEIEQEQLENMSFLEALDYARDKKKKDWSKKTLQDYSSKIKYLKQGAVKLCLDTRRIRDLKKTDFRRILEETMEMRGYSAKKYNTYREYLSSLVSELVEWDILEANPIYHIKTKDVLKKIAHRPPTEDERSLIVNRIRDNHRNYFRFIAVLYGCTIRPKEITRIRIKYLHKQEGIFRLPAEITKTGMERDIPVPNWLMDLLSELNLHKHDPNHFLFSGKGRTFLPGPNQMHSNTPTYYWRMIVKAPKEKGGLGLKVDQYGLKKLAGDELVKLKRNEGMENALLFAQRQMGHEDQRQTAIYTQEDRKIINGIIQAKMPEL